MEAIFIFLQAARGATFNKARNSLALTIHPCQFNSVQPQVYPPANATGAQAINY